MTVATQTNKVIANGNGVATSFSFSPMVIEDDDELLVVKRASDGTETTLTKGTGTSNYSVSVSSYPGTGTITYPASGTTLLDTGEKLAIIRRKTLEQQTDLENQGGYFPDVQELQFDRLVMIDLQQQEQIDRAFKIGPSDNAGANLTIPALEASKYLGVNSGGTGLVWLSLTSSLVGISAFGQTLVDDIDAATARTTLGVTQTNLGLSAFIQTLTDDADAATARNTLLAAQSASPKGLKLSNNATDANNDIDIAAGEILSSDGTYVIRLASGLTKRLDASWAVGTNQGGLDTGSEASGTCYAVWAIARPDTGVCDVLFSASFTAPTMPDAAYTKKAFIGAFVNNGSGNIRPFTQVGAEFWFTDDYGADVNDSAMTDETFKTATLIAPPNSVVKLYANVIVASPQAGVEVSMNLRPTGSTQAYSATRSVARINTGNADVSAAGVLVDMLLSSSRQIDYAVNQNGTQDCSVVLTVYGFRLPQLACGGY